MVLVEDIACGADLSLRPVKGLSPHRVEDSQEPETGGRSEGEETMKGAEI